MPERVDLTPQNYNLRQLSERVDPIPPNFNWLTAKGAMSKIMEKVTHKTHCLSGLVQISYFFGF